GPNEIHLYESAEHHGNWLDCIRSRRETIAPVEIAHRACSTCLLHHIAMKTKRRMHWDPAKERFINDDAANAILRQYLRIPGHFPQMPVRILKVPGITTPKSILSRFHNHRASASRLLQHR